MAPKQTSGHVRTKGRGGGGMSMDINWKVTPTAMAESYAGWWQYTQQRLDAALEQAGQAGIAYARIAHPWRNRTGAAESGLSVKTTRSGNALTLTISHGVFYGVYLENRWGGRWGVIPATIDYTLPVAMQAMQEALR